MELFYKFFFWADTNGFRVERAGSRIPHRYGSVKSTAKDSRRFVTVGVKLEDLKY